MVGLSIYIHFFFGDYYGNSFSNWISDEYGLYDLYGIYFGVKE
jgi:hypothetical protein